jgi:hypothetical protein
MDHIDVPVTQKKKLRFGMLEHVLQLFGFGPEIERNIYNTQLCSCKIELETFRAIDLKHRYPVSFFDTQLL